MSLTTSTDRPGAVTAVTAACAATLGATLHVLGARLDALRSEDARERGDVPGWVMITLMTAGLVAALALVAQPALTAMFERAMAKVGG
ncbi:hypothetical protein MM440_11130 [Arsenicicoccus piscis]|uniref:Uncharacterized protein n=1 Tax=Arsenicicoccus piscis TaxID=673954 RepID=A0ABQ6HLN9_9MICO|nr:hypothetical protein [Arsenicicoccus piscis]MCH8628312.1 hypothetical protein [Arsenicicoccus piscis]GMA18578.1 hypothetical protein GCM10025862_05990 [Arsenicicoccus piscis]